MNLVNKVAIVAGATRGAGRAMAVKLGEAGATVYVTGRTTRTEPSPMDRRETIEETAELVNEAGGAWNPCPSGPYGQGTSEGIYRASPV